MNSDNEEGETMSEDEPIPAQRIQLEHEGGLAPMKNLPVESNGGRTMPHIIEEQINTWTRHGLKILRGVSSSTVIARHQKVLCVVTVDQEKVEAIIHALQVIDSTRQAEAETGKAPAMKPS